MTTELKLISSMATRQLLTELAAQFGPGGLPPLAIESVGGVDAARRVRAGEALDIVVLAGNVVDALIAEGHLVAASRVDLVRSGVAVAVRAGAPRPDIGSEDALRRAVLAAASLSYSTGPSGVHLAKLFERWGVAAQIQPRLVQAPPGVPVGTLVARGEVELGFQQLSELMHLSGIEVLGPLPAAVQILTTFSGAVSAQSAQAEAAGAWLAAMASAPAAAAKIRNGMEAA
jgi:molybdate transport system substrate-binding protein